MSSNLICATAKARECLQSTAPASDKTLERMSELLALAGFTVEYEGLFGVKFSGTRDQFKESFGLEPPNTAQFSIDISPEAELGELVAQLTGAQKVDWPRAPALHLAL